MSASGDFGAGSAPATSQGPRERKKADRRERILGCAMALIEARGMKGATFELIAARAGVSRGTVFNYFPNKQSILVAYFGRQLDGLARRVEKRRAHAGFDALAEIEFLFSELAAFVAAHPGFILPISFELLDPNAERSRAAFLALPLVEMFRAALRRAQSAGQVRTDYSSERLARSLANAYFITALQWAAYRQDRSVHDELAVALRLALDGLRV